MSEQLAFYFDQTRCGACNACTVACKDWNQVNPGPARWRDQFTHETDKGFFPLSMGCNHCDNPACVTACAMQAISKNADTGVVTIDRSKCIGLGHCMTACPFGKPVMADDKQEPNPQEGWQIWHPVQKCDMCASDRLVNNLKPACVLSCVGRALDHGTVSYITSTYPDAVKLNSADFPYAFVNNTNDTGPNIYIKKLPDVGASGGMAMHKSSSYTGKR